MGMGRRGMALLLVLGLMVLLISASVSLARIAATQRLQATCAHRTVVADDLLIATDALILQWLKDASQNVTLPPELQSPRLKVSHQVLSTGFGLATIDIVAFDQRGMISFQLVRSGHPARLALPQTAQHMLQFVDRLELQTDQPVGLDQIVHRAEADPLRVFPLGDLAETQMAVGEVIAMQNDSDFVLNVNTAPMEVIEAAMRAAGLGGIEQIAEARSSGKLAIAPHAQTSANVGGDSIQFVATSDLWAFRIDIAVETFRRSWWAVYSKSNNHVGQQIGSINALRTGGHDDWECVQRLAITE
jgi:hypothetical protein